MSDLTRRRFLSVGAAGVAGAFAGCPAQEQLDRVETEVERVRQQRSGPDLVSEGEPEFDDETRERLRETALEARRSVLHLEYGRGSGTGWVLDADAGYVVTNAHVAQLGDTFTIETFEGETGEAETVDYESDLDPDVGLLRTDLSGLEVLPTGSSDDLSGGDPLLTIGHPSRTGKWIISAGRYDQHLERIDWLLSTVPSSQGNSGGPLLTADGTVVGLVSGTTAPEDSPHTRSDEVFTRLPQVGKTTAAPIETVLDRVDEWR